MPKRRRQFNEVIDVEEIENLEKYPTSLLQHWVNGKSGELSYDEWHLIFYELLRRFRAGLIPSSCDILDVEVIEEKVETKERVICEQKTKVESLSWGQMVLQRLK